MSWTTSAELRTQVQRLWDRGLLLECIAAESTLFPRRLTLKAPNSQDFSNRFGEVRDWISSLKKSANNYRIVFKILNHRIIGTNEIPTEIWVDSLCDALGLINKKGEAKRFAALLLSTREKQPELIPWIIKKPLPTLELADDWNLLLKIVSWISAHPKPGIYLRQVDLPGVHSKFIEKHRELLADLLNLVLKPEAINPSPTGINGFCRRYGFKDKPLRIRFRLLDSKLAILPTPADQDITLTQSAFADLKIPVDKVFITENEINFLAFPPVQGAMAIFGAGYGFENLSGIPWLKRPAIHYWGDIDTHGFAILNQLREVLPHTQSFLMDQVTLLSHRELWGREPDPKTGILLRLTSREQEFFEKLAQHFWGERIRLEQERVGYDHLLAALAKL